MNVIWFSEIKWNYLRTRKQQILSRFPSTCSIFFIEPISRILPNYFTFRSFNTIKTITIPQIRSVRGIILNSILSLSIVRLIINTFASLWFNVFFLRQINTVDCIITSNVFWAKTLRRIKKSKPDIHFIYDCNDNPLAFPGTSSYKKDYYFQTLNLVNKVIVPFESYIDFIPKRYQSKIVIIENGVDFKLFQKPTIPLGILNNIPNPIIMYIGALSEWFHFQLIKEAAIRTGYSFILVGPVSPTVKNQLDQLISLQNISYFPPILHEEIPNYLSHADLCIIPFIKNELTISVLPNKMFEYAASGKSCLMTDFNPSLRKYSDFVSITSDNNEFTEELVNLIHKPRKENHMKGLAINYDWEKLSADYYDYIHSIVTKKTR